MIKVFTYLIFLTNNVYTVLTMIVLSNALMNIYKRNYILKVENKLMDTS